MRKLLTTCVTSVVLGLCTIPAYAGGRDRDENRGRTHDARDERAAREERNSRDERSARDREREKDREREREHDRRGGVSVDVDISLGRDRFERPQRYETRTESIWIEPTYRTVCDRVWVDPEYQVICDNVWHEPEYTTQCNRVWVDAVYEWRDVFRFDHCGNRICIREQVLVCAGYWEDRREQVFVREGYWENVERRVCVREGYWRDIQRQEVVCAGHWEYKEVRIASNDRAWRY